VPDHFKIRTFTPSFGSGLSFHRRLDDGRLEFFAVSDRGPNGDGPMAPHPDGGLAESKIFPAPEFIPSIAKVVVGADARVVDVFPLRFNGASPASGLPRPPGSVGHSNEVPLDESLRAEIPYHSLGLDPEGIAFDARHNCLWIADDYGPFLLRVHPTTGEIQQTYALGQGLPAILGLRAPNRGVEGLTLDPVSGLLYLFVQSPLMAGDNPDAPFLRWICFDPEQGAAVAMYAYPLDHRQYRKGRAREAKLGDFAALGDGKFMVIEQGKGPDGAMFHHLILASIDQASNVLLEGVDLEQSAIEGGPAWAQIQPVRKQLFADLASYGWQAEKAEGLALIDESTLAICSDNDFGLQTILVSPDGSKLRDLEVTDCEVDAHGSFTGKHAGLVAKAVIAPVSDQDRQVDIWLLASPRPFTAAG